VEVMKQDRAVRDPEHAGDFQDRTVSRRRCAIRSLTFSHRLQHWHSLLRRWVARGARYLSHVVRLRGERVGSMPPATRRPPGKREARDSQYQAAVVVMQVIFRFNRPNCGVSMGDRPR
jgi:hypothetical protein